MYTASSQLSWQAHENWKYLLGWKNSACDALAVSNWTTEWRPSRSLRENKCFPKKVDMALITIEYVINATLIVSVVMSSCTEMFVGWKFVCVNVMHLLMLTAFFSVKWRNPYWYLEKCSNWSPKLSVNTRNTVSVFPSLICFYTAIKECWLRSW